MYYQPDPIEGDRKPMYPFQRKEKDNLKKLLENILESGYSILNHLGALIFLCNKHPDQYKLTYDEKHVRMIATHTRLTHLCVFETHRVPTDVDDLGTHMGFNVILKKNKCEEKKTL